MRCWLLGLTTLFAMGCGGGGNGTVGHLACVPGEQRACACIGGAQGVQMCAADGSRFLDCLGCASPDLAAPETMDLMMVDASQVPPDLAMPDLAMPDLAMPDLTRPPDLAVECDAMHPCGGGRVCDLKRSVCVQCVADGDCPVGRICKSNVCIVGCSMAHPCNNALACCQESCVDITSDFQNCGGCGNTCQGGWNCCSSACSNPIIDVNNCGLCGNVCQVTHGTPACVQRACAIIRCDQGWADCNGVEKDGCETHTDIDPKNCGACNNTCQNGALCMGGTCAVPNCPLGGGGACLDVGTVLFGNIAVGAVSGMQTINFSNCGNSDLTLCAVALGGQFPGDFKLTNPFPPPLMITPGASISVQVQFAPTAKGARTATLNFYSSAANKPVAMVNLSGNGL